MFCPLDSIRAVGTAKGGHESIEGVGVIGGGGGGSKKNMRHLHKQSESLEDWAELNRCNDGKTMTSHCNGSANHSPSLSVFPSVCLIPLCLSLRLCLSLPCVWLSGCLFRSPPASHIQPPPAVFCRNPSC